jgi:hypothetical protein
MTLENGEPTIILGSGTVFDYREPEAAFLTIEDVAFGLAAASRFAGQAVLKRDGRRVRYNVAEHCCHAHDQAEPEDRYPALMHELGEPTCGDMVAPLKILLPEFRVVEKRCEAAAKVQFRVPSNPDLDKRLKLIDLRLCVTEKLFLRSPRWTEAAQLVDSRWDGPIEPFDFVIWEPLGFDEAAHAFLERFAACAPEEVLDEHGYWR